jgi:hypothetical protein
VGQEYSTDILMEKARRWREQAAAASDAVHRDLYLEPCHEV